MDPRLVEMGSLGALLDAPEPPGWTVSGLREARRGRALGAAGGRVWADRSLEEGNIG